MVARHALLTCVAEEARVALAVALGKRLHHSVNLLSLSRKSEAAKKRPESSHQVKTVELVHPHKLLKNLNVELFPGEGIHVHQHPGCVQDYTKIILDILYFVHLHGQPGYGFGG